MKRYQDPDDPLNGELYRTGKPCIEPSCDRSAGTAWSPLWCQPCNAKRMDRISAELDRIGDALGVPRTTDSGTGWFRSHE